jgi:NDP-sugar pyrophosphorylase family protein
LAVIGVIPAAGYATRLQPIECSKEVYPIGGKPVMDYVIERMRRAPCSELRVVTRPEKRDVIENARRHGAVVIEAYPKSLAESYFTGLRGLADEDTVLLDYPDSIWEPADGSRRVIEFLRGGNWDIALGLLRSPAPHRQEPVTLEESGRVSRILFKPKDPPSPAWTWGCAAAPAHILRPLEHEQEPGVYFNRLCPRGRVGAVVLPGTFLDMGTPEGLREVLESLAPTDPAPSSRSPQ